MDYSRWRLHVTLVLGILLFVLPLASSAQDQTRISLYMPEELMSQGRYTFAVKIDCVAEFCPMFDLTFNYDPALFSIDALELGEYLGAQAETVMSEIQNPQGWARMAAMQLETPSNPQAALTDQTLAYVQVTANTSARPQMVITDAVIGDIAGTLLATTVEQMLVDSNACQIYATSQVSVHVGPSDARNQRQWLPLDMRFTVSARYSDAVNGTWWMLEFPNANPGEEDRYWVNSAEVQTEGECGYVALRGPSEVIEARVAPTALPLPPTAVVGNQGGSSGTADTAHGGSTGSTLPTAPPATPIPFATPVPDRDGDGVPDWADLCPDVWGWYSGCPFNPSTPSQINS